MTSLILPQDVVDELQERDRQELMRQTQEQASLMGAMGVKTVQHYDAESDSLVIQRQQDASGALDFAQAMRCAHPRNGYNEDRTLRHVGEVPVVLIEEWINRGWVQSITDGPGIRAMLTRPEYAYLRTVDKL